MALPMTASAGRAFFQRGGIAADQESEFTSGGVGFAAGHGRVEEFAMLRQHGGGEFTHPVYRHGAAFEAHHAGPGAGERAVLAQPKRA